VPSASKIQPSIAANRLGGSRANLAGRVGGAGGFLNANGDALLPYLRIRPLNQLVGRRPTLAIDDLECLDLGRS